MSYDSCRIPLHNGGACGRPVTTRTPDGFPWCGMPHGPFPETARRRTGGGRNEPCACGSGRRWKRCCGLLRRDSILPEGKGTRGGGR